MSIFTPENILLFIQNAYQTFDRLNLSVGMLAAVALIVTIAFLFAIREVAAWFFKIDNLKSDIRALEAGVARLEAEIRAFQRPTAQPTLQSVNDSAAKVFRAETRSQKEQFPINH